MKADLATLQPVLESKAAATAELLLQARVLDGPGCSKLMLCVDAACIMALAVVVLVVVLIR